MAPGAVRLASQEGAAQAVLAALARPVGGACLTGPAGSGKSTILATVLQEHRAAAGRLAVLPPDASPAELAAAIGASHPGPGSAADRTGWVLAIDDADELRRDTLDLLNQLADGQHAPLRILLTGRATLLDRLRMTELRALLAHLAPVSIPPLDLDEVARLREGRPGASRALPEDATPGAVLAERAEPPQAAFVPSRHRGRWAGLGVAAAACALALAGLLVPRHMAPGVQPAAVEAVTPPPAPILPPQPVPPDSPLQEADRPEAQPRALRGLVLVAEPGDTLRSLYRRVYRGQRHPSFEQLAAANPGPIRPGAVLVFPAPPGGWRGR